MLQQVDKWHKKCRSDVTGCLTHIYLDHLALRLHLTSSVKCVEAMLRENRRLNTHYILFQLFRAAPWKLLVFSPSRIAITLKECVIPRPPVFISSRCVETITVFSTHPFTSATRLVPNNLVCFAPIVEAHFFFFCFREHA